MCQRVAAVETKGVARRFGGVVAGGRHGSVGRVDTFFGFLGPNGAGKSTTIEVLTGLPEPAAGSARVLGFDVVEDPVEAKRRAGVVPEEEALSAASSRSRVSTLLRGG